MNYDATADYIDTPGGPGRFIEYDGTTKTVTVEMDERCMVIYPASICFVNDRQMRMQRQRDVEKYFEVVKKALSNVLGGE